jgi:hypothetical protein
MKADQPQNLFDELRELEKRAGIFDQAERAREGPLFPLCAFGGDFSSEEYFDDQHDDIRRNTRGLYFGVEDADLRRQLIVAHRSMDKLWRRELSQDIHKAKQTLEAKEAKLDHQPWEWAALIGVASVAAGSYMWALSGAIGGAVFGYFMGHSIIATARAKAKQQIRQATRDLALAIGNEEEAELRPATFSNLEETTGERDSEFDHQSAFYNRIENARNKRSP